MKQPELGRKIAELRKAKGLTQEEVVEKCNINVRTIQRIETGEVTPRDYTIRTILEAMDVDISEIKTESSDKTIKYLTIAGIGGILYFILGFPEAGFEMVRMMQDASGIGFPGFDVFDIGEDYDRTWYTIVKVLVLFTYFFFMGGFVIIGKEFDNTVLKVVAMILIASMTITLIYDIASSFYDSSERMLLLPALSVTLGALGIVFGVALLRLNQTIGVVGLIAGVFEIIAGAFFLFVTPIGFFFLAPAEVFEIIILFKAAEILKKQGVN